jgi:hypothetical protein
MKNRKFLFYMLPVVVFSACQLTLESPALLRAFQTPASSEEVIRFSQRIAAKSDLLTLETIGRSEMGKPLIAIKAALPGKQTEGKLKVLLFAQQHGNEQSSKEALLLLLSDIARGEHKEILANMDIWIIPQVNPDGADANERRSAGGLDLNRDHIVMLGPETRAVRELFHRELFHVTADIHEYNPFNEEWEQFGGYKNFDVQVGVPTNPNVSAEIRDYALNDILPDIESHLNSRGYSFHNYLVGPVPSKGRTRHSTTDINDGRQSFAILNTLSLIYEGINGRDGYIENLERRTYGQYEAIMALISHLSANHSKVKNLVETTRKQLIEQPQPVAIRMEHFPGNAPLRLPLISSVTGTDTMVVVDNFHPVVKSTLETERPLGYLVPRSDTLLMNLLRMHRVQIQEQFSTENIDLFEWNIHEIKEVIAEESANRFPLVSKRAVTDEITRSDFILVPTAQLHSNFLVLLFEPESMLGIAQRPGYEHLLTAGSVFPVLRAEKRNP